MWEQKMEQLKAYAEDISLPSELTDLLSDAFDEEGCVEGSLSAS
jgi:hypothetical protein